LRVVVPDGWSVRVFFTLADNNAVILRGLQRDDEDLEELFHRVLSENEGNPKSEIRNPKEIQIPKSQ